MAMTKKQKIFADEYLIDLNATQAAIRAGYSPHTAKDIGCENLAKPNIRTYIEQAMAERSKRVGVNADRVLQELAKIALVNPGNVINAKDATIRPEATEEDRAAIMSVKVKQSVSQAGESVEREIRMADKLKALELLGKHLGMFKDNLNVNVESSKKLDDILSQMGGEGLEE